ncbi:uncharacterized protein LOC132045370 [Lycium ferocissimum]|uniref:uncharacterized protein LOC132045370 n=1 Tax=Lycium ferocissimum TaxID=112874 RepID=UPI002815D27B|nr:uncharacterized protein LOC132045370 [Lycium ferocissimum]
MLCSARSDLPFGSRKDESDWNEEYRRMCPFHYFKSKVAVNFWKKFINPRNLPPSNFRPTGDEDEVMYPAKLNQLSEVYQLGDFKPKYRMFFLELYHDVYALNDEVRDCLLLFLFLFLC